MMTGMKRKTGPADSVVLEVRLHTKKGKNKDAQKKKKKKKKKGRLEVKPLMFNIEIERPIKNEVSTFSFFLDVPCQIARA